MATGELFEELYLCLEKNSKPVGVKLGSLVFAPNLAPVDPCTGAIKGKDLDGQISATFDAIDAFLKSAGLGHDNLTRVTFFMTDLTERKKLNPPWEKWFPNPNDRPPHKYVPTSLPEGLLVSAQVMALADAPNRRVLEVEGLVHQDPMSMGALTGNLITTSRIFAGQRSEDVAQQTASVFESVGAVLKDAGAQYSNLTQVTAFIGDPKFQTIVEKEFERLVGTGKDAPVLNVLETDLGGGGFPRVEILGLI